MKIDKVVAVIPPTGGKSFANKCVPPLGLVRVLNYVQTFFPNIKVELLDGVMLDMPTILKKVKLLSEGVLLAISAHTSYNYRNCLRIVNSAPKDVKIIMGGLHLYEDHLGKIAVEKRNFHVIHGQGEFALPQYIEYLEGKRAIADVGNLMYLQNGIFTKNAAPYYSQEEFQFPEYKDILSLKKYGKNYKKTFGESDLALVVMSPEGCLWKHRTGGCLFCDIGSAYRCHSPTFLPRWISHHIQRYGTGKKITFWNYADEVSGTGYIWWKEVKKNMDNLNLWPGKDFSLKVYIKSGRGFFDNDKIALALKDCGTEIVHLGVEGGDDATLKAWRKGCAVKNHLGSADIAGRHGLKMILSFAIGAPGTTRQSLANIRNLIYRMKEKTKIIAVAALTVAPMPGSLMWKTAEKIVKEKYTDSYHDLFLTDDPDLEKVREIWINEMCPDLVKDLGSLGRAMEWLRNESESICKLGSSGTVSRIE